MLSRKHYRLIAHAINTNTLKERNNNYLFKNLLIRDLIHIFARDNHLFDSRRFESACCDD